MEVSEGLSEKSQIQLPELARGCMLAADSRAITCFEWTLDPPTYSRWLQENAFGTGFLHCRSHYSPNLNKDVSFETRLESVKTQARTLEDQFHPKLDHSRRVCLRSYLSKGGRIIEVGRRATEDNTVK